MSLAPQPQRSLVGVRLEIVPLLERAPSRRLDEEELADWRAGRNAVYQLAALTIGTRLAVADA